ncbi:hypothetical protein HYV86_01200 [Candidatus Woesearchaeota archaeon]|nr:hypothetical protein [Candidatus Woesearchaeota archaeon]
MSSYQRVVSTVLLPYVTMAFTACGEDFEQSGQVGFNQNDPSPIYNPARCDSTVNCAPEQPAQQPSPNPTPQPQPTPHDAGTLADIVDTAIPPDASWAGLCAAYGNAGDGSACTLFDTASNEYDDRGQIGCGRRGEFCCYDPRLDANAAGLPADYCTPGNLAPSFPRLASDGQCVDQRAFGIENCVAYVMDTDGKFKREEIGEPSCNTQGTACCYVDVGTDEKLFQECQPRGNVTLYNPREQTDQ